ncbi:tyrosine phosphatase-like protein [Geopyxis carbonaria]|nr:tyrosine phosphatase-like protein [Geopyxis carbonaria]
MDRSPGLSLKTRYLVAYNLLSAVLWLGVLGRVVLLLPLVGAEHIHAAVGEYTKWVQTLAVLEIVHISAGLLKSSLPTTVLQVASRLLLVWGVCDRFAGSASSTAYSSMLIAWSVTEVARYSYYVVNLLRATSGVLSWLRYNTFWVLYPVGAGSEAWCIFQGLREAQGQYGWGYYTFLVVVLATYPPGLWNQYSHMIRQRRKNMRGKKRA